MSQTTLCVENTEQYLCRVRQFEPSDLKVRSAQKIKKKCVKLHADVETKQ